MAKQFTSDHDRREREQQALKAWVQYQESGVWIEHEDANIARAYGVDIVRLWTLIDHWYESTNPHGS